MKLIHCSDIHLDSPLEANLSSRQARERNAELLGTFSRLISYAREESVTAVLIAGDLFDGTRVRSATAQLVLDLMAQAPEVDFLYLRGNHDETGGLPAALTLPDNLKLFGENWSYFSYDNVTVAGIQPETGRFSDFYGELALEKDRLNIVMLHGQESTQPGEELVCLPLLKNRHIRYLALGHIHSFRQAPLDHDSTWCYCGCLEGRGFDECGEKGFVLLETAGDRITSRFVPFAQRQLHEIPVDITDLETLGELRNALAAASQGISREDLVKFVLTGTYTLDTQKDLAHLTAFLKDRFYFAKIKDESTLRIDKASYEHDASLKGEFIRTVMASELSREDKERIIGAGLLALSGEEVEL